MSALAQPRALGHAAAAVRPFRLGSRTHLAIIAKALFQITHKRAMTVLPPAKVAVSDVPASSDPRASLAIAAENAPFLPRADVLFLAHAWARQNAPVPLVPVRFRVGIDGTVLLDKAIHVYGDRRGRDPEPFLAIPLVYERALGGGADPENPAGRDPRTGALPNLIDPHHPHRAVGVGPIAPHWPSRRRHLGPLDPRGVEAAWPSVPDGFDWSFFQSAPTDQQIPHLRGREWLVLEGVSPHLPRIDACLPGAVGEARVWLPGGRGPEPVPLSADMLLVDANQGTCAVVWRGHIEIPEQALSAVRVAASVTLPGEQVRWEEPAPAATANARPRTFADSGAQAPSPLHGGLPFASPIHGSAQPASTGQQAATPGAPAAPSAHAHATTLIEDPETESIDEETLARLTSGLPNAGAPHGLPFAHNVSPAPQAPATPASTSGLPFAPRPSQAGLPVAAHAQAPALGLPFHQPQAPSPGAPLAAPAPAIGLPFQPQGASSVAPVPSAAPGHAPAPFTPLQQHAPAPFTPLQQHAPAPFTPLQEPAASGLRPPAAAERMPAPKVVLPSYALKQAASAPQQEDAKAPFILTPVTPAASAQPERIHKERPRRQKRSPRAPLRPEERPKSAPLVPPRKRRPADVASEGVGAKFLKIAEPAAPARGGA